MNTKARQRACAGGAVEGMFWHKVVYPEKVNVFNLSRVL